MSPLWVVGADSLLRLLLVNQKRAAVADDPKLADQGSNIEGKLQAYEFIAHYNSLRKQLDGSAMLGKVTDVEGERTVAA